MAAGITATISVEAFRADWLEHLPMRDLAQRYTITRDQVIRLAVVWDLPRRHDRSLRARGEPIRDPSLAEIARACREIQATWDERTREMRRVTKTQNVTFSPIEFGDDVGPLFDDPEVE
jgi:hypothetical protein